MKPHLADGFDPHLLEWGEGSAAAAIEDDGSNQDDEAGEDAEPAEEPEASCQRAFGERGGEGALSEDGSR